MSIPDESITDNATNQFIVDEMSYDRDAMRSKFDGLYPRLSVQFTIRLWMQLTGAEVVCSFYTAMVVHTRLLFRGRCVPACMLEEI